jgi:hypothetical protein
MTVMASCSLFRLLDHRPRQGNSLFFATRQALSGIADHSIKLLGQVENEICRCKFQRLFQVLIRGILVCPQKIIADRIMKQEHILRHIGDGFAPVQTVFLVEQNTVNLDGARVRGQQSHDQIGQGRFS